MATTVRSELTTLSQADSSSGWGVGSKVIRERKPIYNYHKLLLAKGKEYLSVNLVLAGHSFMQYSIPADENHLLPFGSGVVEMCWSREQACLVVIGMDILPVRVPIYVADKHITVYLQTDFNLHNLKNDNIINKTADV